MDERIIGKIQLIDSVIDFPKNGKDNYVICDNTYGDVFLEKSSISFKGSGSVVYLVGGEKKGFKFKLFVSNGSSIFIGKDTLFHKSGNIHVVATENSHIIIGNECMIANNVWIRTGDAHPIYSTKTGERINCSKNVIIGDHVWLTQDCLVFKGTLAGSGSIFGAKSVLSNKKFYSNTSYAGTPAKAISEEGAIFFDNLDTNLADVSTLNNILHFESDKYVYNYSKEENIFDDVQLKLSNAKTANDIIEIYKNLSTNKNRFALSSSDSVEEQKSKNSIFCL